jgi:hypothetical protein
MLLLYSADSDCRDESSYVDDHSSHYVCQFIRTAIYCCCSVFHRSKGCFGGENRLINITRRMDRRDKHGLELAARKIDASVQQAMKPLRKQGGI